MSLLGDRVGLLVLCSAATDAQCFMSLCEVFLASVLTYLHYVLDIHGVLQYIQVQYVFCVSSG